LLWSRRDVLLDLIRIYLCFWIFVTNLYHLLRIVMWAHESKQKNPDRGRFIREDVTAGCVFTFLGTKNK
jgi:hypothetical protein